MTSRRPRSIEIPGHTHGNIPIPCGARVGNLVLSSGILGKDTSNDTLPADAAEQVRFAFENLCTFLELAGATLDDVAKVTIHTKEDSTREFTNVHWVRLFPDPKDRPARQTIIRDLRQGLLVQLEVVAFIQP